MTCYCSQIHFLLLQHLANPHIIINFILLIERYFVVIKHMEYNLHLFYCITSLCHGVFMVSQ